MPDHLKMDGLADATRPKIRRLNRLPIVIAIGLVLIFFAVIFYGLATRRLLSGDSSLEAAIDTRPASSYADQLTRDVPDGIVGVPAQLPLQPFPTLASESDPAEIAASPIVEPTVEPEELWRARLAREHHESYLREQHRQRMARLQANDAAYDSPIAVDISDAAAPEESAASNPTVVAPVAPRTSALDLYASALQHGLSGHDADPNGQNAKKRFFNEDIRDSGYLSSRVIPKISPYELKRGSVIPATLITGINSDLPGRVTAQVSRNVYDSATGRHLLISLGSRLFGRYDSNVSFGQGRVLVVWTDIIFPDGSTLQLEGMSGADAAGYSGFKDRVNNHYLRTFGSAILVALIGTGTEMLLPSKPNSHNHANNAEDFARRSFGETLGQMSQQTISKNLGVQPTLEIRPGYQFNVMVEKDIIFPSASH